MIKEIASRHNARFKVWSSLLESKGIRKEGLALVSGLKVIDELLLASKVSEILLPPKGSIPELSEENADIPMFRLTSELFKSLDVAGTGKMLAVVPTPVLDRWSKVSGLSLVLALSDPSNLGACLRTAEAMDVAQVILTKECASPFLPKALRAGSGAAFRLKLTTAGALADLDLPSAIGLDMQGENLHNFVWPRETFLIVGEEGQGLPAHLKLKRVKIPMKASTESLNAVVAASIALYSYRGRHPLT